MISKAIFVPCLLGALAVISAIPADFPVEDKPCGKGEVFNSCGSACPETCDSKGDTCKACIAVCVEGCFCAGNTIRAPNGTCVAPEQCPPRTCSGLNEVFEECPPSCPRTEECYNLWSDIPCAEIDCCTPQCRCKTGFYRNKHNKCISAKKCSTSARQRNTHITGDPPQV